MLVNQ